MASVASASTVLVLLGFCVSVIFIVFVCTRFACALVRLRRRRRLQRRSPPPLPHYAVSPYVVFPLHHLAARHPGGSAGLDPAAVAAFPTRAFVGGDSGASDADSQCVVCLAEYEDKDMLRFLPYCGHNFHMDCIDLWLEQNSTCPVCRVSLRDNLDKIHIAPPPPILVISTGHTSEVPRHEPDEENQIASCPSADGAGNNFPVHEVVPPHENNSQPVTKQVDLPS